MLLDSKGMESDLSKEKAQEKLAGLESLINVQQTLAEEKMSMLFRKVRRYVDVKDEKQ